MKATINNRLLSSLNPKEKPFEVRDSKLSGFILRIQPSGRMTYICQYGRAKRITIGKASVLTQAQARDRAKGILADVVKGVDPIDERREAKAYTLQTYLEAIYSPYVDNHHRKGAATIARLKANFLTEFGKMKLSELTFWQFDKWRSARLKKGIRPATVNRDLNMLKAALSRAVQWNFIKVNPLSSLKPIKVDNAAYVRFLEDHEEDRLRAALDTRDDLIRQARASANTWREERGYKTLSGLSGSFADHLKPMVILSLNTGLRRGELFNLKWIDVDLDRAILTVKGQGTKSGLTRHVPLNDEALDALSKWRAQSKDYELIFPGRDGERITNVNNSWRKLLRDAGIANFRWHDMRHHFASRLVMSGVDLNTVRELLGHSDLKMTLRYAHLAPAVKAAAVQKLVRVEHLRHLQKEA